MRVRLLRIILCMAAAAWGHPLNAQQEKQQTTHATILVPLPTHRIGRIEWGGKPCSFTVENLDGVTRAPVVVLVSGGAISQEYTSFLRLQLGELLRETRSLQGKIEVWGVGTASYVAGARFSDGVVATPVPGDPVSNNDYVFVDYPSMLRSIARRFDGEGPVRLFWIDRSFSWLDARGSTDHFWSPIDDDLDLIRKAGLTMHPIVIRDRMIDAKASQRLSAWAAWLLGSQVQILSPHGRSLVEIIRETEGWSVVTLRREGRSTFRPAVLRVLDHSGRMRYSRPLQVSSAANRVEDPPEKILKRYLYRIVHSLEFQQATTVPECHGRKASGGLSLILLSGLALKCEPLSECDTAVEIVVRYDQGVGRLATRSENQRFQVTDGEACIGPIEVHSGARVSVWSKEGPWLAHFGLQ
jgi:hypothetical protein